MDRPIVDRMEEVMDSRNSIDAFHFHTGLHLPTRNGRGVYIIGNDSICHYHWNHDCIRRATRLNLSLNPIAAATIIKDHNVNVYHAPVLGGKELAVASTMVLFVSLVMRILGLKDLSGKIVVASTRMSVQLLFIGALILSKVFKYGHKHPSIIFLWLIIVGVAASFEVSSRISYKYQHILQDCIVAMMIGTFGSLITTAIFILKAKPWWAPNILVPVAGMLYGKCLSTLSLGMASLLTDFTENKDIVELRLARGATIRESTLPALRKAMSTALMPTIDAMTATGLITLPGMMTGQILGGQSPRAAATYQVMIFSSMCVSACSSFLIMSYLLLNRIFCWRSMRFRDSVSLSIKNKQSNFKETESELRFSDSTKRDSLALHKEEALPSLNEYSEVLLSIENVVSERLSAPISITLARGEKCGVSGKSGVGKTQLLRSIAGLGKISNGTVNLNGKSMGMYSMNNWRSNVMWVSQDRPVMAGTPNEFYDEIMSYQSQIKNRKYSKTKVCLPSQIAANWFLGEEIFDRPWNTLSGGEAQRASLSIALALQPSVLLLDEPTSACDPITTLMIEETLLQNNDIAIIVVSHDSMQLDRLCTTRLHL